jgi:hypothetical protein
MSQWLISARNCIVTYTLPHAKVRSHLGGKLMRALRLYSIAAAATFLCTGAHAEQLIGSDSHNITLYDTQTGVTRALVDVRTFNPNYDSGGSELAYDPFQNEIFVRVVQTSGGIGVGTHTLGVDASSGQLLSDMVLPPGNVPNFTDSTWGRDMLNQINALSTAVSGNTAQINALSTTVSGNTAQINALSTTVSGNTAQIAQLQRSVAALNAGFSDIGARLHVLDEKQDAQSAIAATMGFAMPLDGRENRIGYNMGTIGGATAFAMTYTHVSGPLDFHAGVSTTGRFAGGTVGLGYSW